MGKYIRLEFFMSKAFKPLTQTHPYEYNTRHHQFHKAGIIHDMNGDLTERRDQNRIKVKTGFLKAPISESFTSIFQTESGGLINAKFCNS
ncbi:hypothetical protein EPICR_10324 [Candidatus Desulfarcum epimagneticum]|uniref:Uncharacterized protein n=1 Tax=uncultured Desulfobacteraceae bacterium TaxID=218296 RepID=A0A484HCD0_9BACT|nr:hypothetical protein EPICR_10324 [uncultured Desulfobacteraceae bacterium]